MKFCRFRKIPAGARAAGLTLLAAATLLFQTSITRAAGHGPLRITFEKCFVEDNGPFGGHYEGSVAGDLGPGDVIFTFESVLPGEVIWQFSGVYTITTAQGTFSAFAAGIDNLRSGSGHDVLNGEVIAGDDLGAQVQVRAHDTRGGLCSEGTITITPGK
jgi:hypothetical protein